MDSSSEENKSALEDDESFERDYVVTHNKDGTPLSKDHEECLIQKLIRLKMEADKKVEEENKETLPPVDLSLKDKIIDEELEEYIDFLVLTLDENRDILYLLMFIAAIEDDEKLTISIKEKTDNFEGYNTPENQNDLNNLAELLTNDPLILNRAFIHAINLRSIPIIEYIIKGAENLYLNPSIDDAHILKLVEDYKDPKCIQILKLICIKEITLINDEEITLDLSMNNHTDLDSSIRKSSNLFLGQRMNSKPIESLGQDKLGISKFKDQTLKNKKRKRNGSVRVSPKKNQPKKKSKPLPPKPEYKKKKSPFNKFLEKSDIIEVAIRAAHISDDQEMELITELYDLLTTPTSETVALYKLLIYYEQIQTFELTLKNRIKHGVSKDRTMVTVRDLDEIQMGRKDDDNVYDFDEIISDAFAYSIRLNKIHISFYLFKKYEDDVYGNKFLCIKAIFESFKNDDTQINHVMYLEERLFILEKFSKYIEYKMGLEFLNIMHDQVLDDPKDNFLVYCPNPLKIIILLLNISIGIKTKHQNLKFKAQKFRSTLCDIAHSVIDTASNMNEVEDLLRDKTYSGMEVLDLIAHLDIIEILQNTMIDSIISNMYFGPYERETFLKKSTCYKIVEEQVREEPGTEGLVTRSFKIISFKNNFKGLKKYFKIQTKLCKKCRRKDGMAIESLAQDEEEDNQEGTVGHMFMFQIWKKSLDVQYLIEAGVIFVIALIWLIFANLVVEITEDIEDLNSEISQQNSVGASQDDIDKNVSKLAEYSSDYLRYLHLLLVVSSLTYTYLLKDIEEHIYCALRSVYLKTFSNKILLNIANAFCVTYWLCFHIFSFDNNTTGMTDTERADTIIARMDKESLFDIRYTLSILMTIQLTRLLFTLQVSRTFGPLVKILVSMLMDVLIFMFLYLLLFLIFTSVGLLLFQELREFSNIGHSAKTLFAASLGDFNFDLFDDIKESSPELGYIFLSVFLLFTAIMLLNFLIAILSNTYAELNDVKNALYLRKVIHLRQRYDYDRLYSAVVFSTPPFNIFSLILAPLVIYKRSRTLNRVILIIQYIWVGALSVVFFSILSVLMIPISYLVLIGQKFRAIPLKPLRGMKDIWYRILDLVLFIFIGIFFLLFWVGLDIFNYSMMLFAYKIIYINDYEEERQDLIIKEMDGTMKKQEDNKDFTKSTSISNTKMLQKQFYHNSSKNKGMNPVKEGLSNNTLKIMKAILNVVKEIHMKNVGDSNHNHFNVNFIPTICVLDEIKQFLLIQEQINTVVLGVTYQKREDFFSDPKFEKLVDAILAAEQRDKMLNAISEEPEKDEQSTDKREVDTLGQTKTPIIRKRFSVWDEHFQLPKETKEADDDRREYWSEYLKSFLTKSNEKWILDQFNLCKKFLNQNSIVGHYDDFSHPAYEEFSHIRSMKRKCTDLDDVLHSKKRFSALVKSSSKDDASKHQREDSNIPVHRISDIDLSVLKCDINSLLRTLEEIQNKVKMNMILSCNGEEIRKEDLSKTQVNNEKFVRQQFSMINFGRNFTAVEYSLNNPSDPLNKFKLR
ncbi:unnamed protein product [Moneuplotes crassus]|uniref:Ion transport domain-containing protein n=2 Tax=Euplotes crassus TaxID=5936 RepID=A0AAD1YAS9_EUPCR|nr:unnamed protein product [Moneuplotes crassus]